MSLASSAVALEAVTVPSVPVIVAVTNLLVTPG
jgi:hypothetical protein